MEKISFLLILNFLNYLKKGFSYFDMKSLYVDKIQKNRHIIIICVRNQIISTYQKVTKVNSKLNKKEQKNDKKTSNHRWNSWQ